MGEVPRLALDSKMGIRPRHINNRIIKRPKVVSITDGQKELRKTAKLSPNKPQRDRFRWFQGQRASFAPPENPTYSFCTPPLFKLYTVLPKEREKHRNKLYSGKFFT